MTTPFATLCSPVYPVTHAWQEQLNASFADYPDSVLDYEYTLQGIIDLANDAIGESEHMLTEAELGMPLATYAAAVLDFITYLKVGGEIDGM